MFGSRDVKLMNSRLLGGTSAVNGIFVGSPSGHGPSAAGCSVPAGLLRSVDVVELTSCGQMIGVGVSWFRNPQANGRAFNLKRRKVLQLMLAVTA